MNREDQGMRKEIAAIVSVACSISVQGLNADVMPLIYKESLAWHAITSNHYQSDCVGKDKSTSLYRYLRHHKHGQ